MGQNFPSFRGMTGDPSNGDTTVEAVGLARGATFLRQKLRSTHWLDNEKKKLVPIDAHPSRLWYDRSWMVVVVIVFNLAID